MINAKGTQENIRSRHQLYLKWLKYDQSGDVLDRIIIIIFTAALEHTSSAAIYKNSCVRVLETSV